MPFASPKSTFAASALAAALNRLLDAQPGALSRLQRHGGKTLRLVLPLLPLSLTLDETSRFRPAIEAIEASETDSVFAAEPALTLTPSPSALPLWLSGGKLADLFRFEGDDLFAADLSGALADFDWVLALRPYLGDIAASRVEQFLRGFGAWREQAVQAAGRNLAEYAVYEQAMLAEPHAARAFIIEVDALREAVDRLEARLKLLESNRKA
jgi:ubiquinone biosynthesis protein UbiJ